MIELHPITNDGETPSGTLTLPFELRKKCRLRATLDSGEDVAIFGDRGFILRDGTHLVRSDGGIVEIRAAKETVSTVLSFDAHLLTRAAYHLGNRHVPLQLGDGWLRYLHDHVLDDMMAGLGMSIQIENAPFEPESGAYGGGHHHSH